MIGHTRGKSPCQRLLLCGYKVTKGGENRHF
jgi:hypothetical protein